jgi:hypothetical protein
VNLIIILICHLFVSPCIIHALFFNGEATFRAAHCHNFSPSSYLHRMPSNINNHENCRDCMIVTSTFRRIAIRYLNAISAAIIVTSKSSG